VELDLSLAASFLVLAEERHYGRAAARLHITSPALTKRVQRLERQLEVLVIDRGPGGVVDLTPAGSRFAAAIGPLLTHARAARSLARSAVRDGPARDLVRFGIPSGSETSLRHLDLRRVAQQLRQTHPNTRLVCTDVDFVEMERCLPDGQVDVLWTDAPVLHSSVTSVRLGLSSRRVGVVSAGHKLAGAGAVNAADLVEERMLYNPAVPQAWMTPFWLGDLRGARQARLIPVDARDHAAVLMHTARLNAVTVILEVSTGLLGPALHPVVLRDVPPVVFHAARRRAEPRGAVHAVISSLVALGIRSLGGPAGSDAESVLAPAVAEP